MIMKLASLFPMKCKFKSVVDLVSKDAEKRVQSIIMKIII